MSNRESDVSWDLDQRLLFLHLSTVFKNKALAITEAKGLKTPLRLLNSLLEIRMPQIAQRWGLASRAMPSWLTADG